MVILFAGRKSKTEEEIISILKDYGANHISDRSVTAINSGFTLVSEYKKTELTLKNGIAVMVDHTERFQGQEFPAGMVGVCENTDKTALALMKQSGIPVVSCGMDGKNTVTLSSLGTDILSLTLQRAIPDFSGHIIEPGDYVIQLKKEYQPFSVMASAAVLLLSGIEPKAF